MRYPDGYLDGGWKNAYMTHPATRNPDVKPYTREELDAVLAGAAGMASNHYERLVATARAGLEDQERLEWIVAHLYYGSLELEVEPGRQSRLCVLTDDSDRDKIASDWRERIDAFRIRKGGSG